MTYEISLQPGHIARHTPRGAGSQGREAAVIAVSYTHLTLPTKA